VPQGPAIWDINEKAHPETLSNRKLYLAPPVFTNLQQNKRALVILRQGFAYEYHEPPVRSFSTIQSHFGRFRQLTRTLILQGNVRAARGDWAGASQSALDILRLGHDIPRGGPLISALAGSSIQRVGLDQLELLLPRFNAESCRIATRRMEQLYARRVPFWQTMQEDKWTTQAGLLEIMKQPNWHTSVLQTLGYKGAARKPQHLLMSKRAVMNSYSAVTDQVIANARLPYAKSPPPPPTTDYISALFTPTYSTVRWAIARAEASTVLLLTALALRAYQLERGIYPEKLAALTPQYLKTIHADPFGSGEALRYKKQGDSYLLWSIGPDTKDDGGKPIDNGKKQRRLVRPESTGDFVFGVNR
jgi:hypothetical protein